MSPSWGVAKILQIHFIMEIEILPKWFLYIPGLLVCLSVCHATSGYMFPLPNSNYFFFKIVQNINLIMI